MTHATRFIALTFFMFLFACGIARAEEAWAYSPDLQPITKQEISRVLRDPKVREMSPTLLSRAGSSGLLEHVVNECRELLKKAPQDYVMRSFYCYALFLAHDPDPDAYNPQDKAAWKKQQNELFQKAGRQADFLILGKGANIPFCWRTLAYLNLQGIGGSPALGIERAKKAVELAPNDHYAHRLLAFGYLQEGPTKDLDKALKEARVAMQLQPKMHKSYLYQAQIFFTRKDYKTAFTLYQKAWALIPPELREGKRLEIYKMYERMAKA